MGDFSEVHLYVQWGGKLPGGEEWSCGLRMRNGANQTGSEAAAAASLSGYATAIEAYHTRATTYIGAACKLSFVKCNAIGLDGKYVSETTNEHIVADVAGGGNTIPKHPNQVALVISLVTGQSRGPAHRGRFYLPLPNFDVDIDGLISTASRDGAKASAETLRTAMNAVTSGWVVGVMSRRAAGPAARDVTGIEVGRVLDTQRRRRRSMAELY